ncbi:MAG: shikimate kinase [Desulfovibrionaceae bacterium]|nr:shikimate kinase [Desulfovibrionaceae bacterium]
MTLEELPEGACISLVGMAGAGKSTVGELLARTLGWGHLDTDRLLEAYFGAPLQDIFDRFGLAEFRRVEERVIAALRVRRMVVSTGGSVIYGPTAVAALRALGPVVFLDATLEDVRRRVGGGEGRGLAIAPGQTIDDLYAERRPLYLAAATHVLGTGDKDPAACVAALLEQLRAAPMGRA